MNELIRLSYAFERAQSDVAARSIDVVASTAAIDSYGEIVAQDWDLSRYLANPVVLYAHDSWMMPIGHASNVRVEKGKLLATLTFVDEKANPLAERVWQGIQQGSLRAVSVGFRTRNKPSSVDVDGKPVLMLTGNELIEISVVPVPANPEAVALAMKSLRAMAREHEEPNMKKLLAILGLEEKATEAEAIAALEGFEAKNESKIASVLELTGAATFEKAVTVVKGWKDSDAKVVELAKAAEVTERKALIEQGRKEKKLSPALAKWAEKQPLDALKEYLETATPIAQLADAPEEPTYAGGTLSWNGKDWDNLTFTQRHALHNENYELYVAMRDAAAKKSA